MYLEGAAGVLINLLLDVEFLTIDLLDAFEGLLEVELLEQAAGDQETGGVGGGEVGQAGLDAVLGQLGGEGLADDLVTGDGGVDDLAHNLGVGGADTQAYLFLIENVK